MCETDPELVEIHRLYLELSPESRHIARLQIRMILDSLRLQHEIAEIIKRDAANIAPALETIHQKQAELLANVQNIKEKGE